ncbi:MAG: PTS sugar transporter subunit IIA [Erysipelotrichaceae bacterium]|nr:PTS sugar transporter subunit IIA [Erysipelotrichaceae bacterium]MBQ1534113.1 PTS sugar transporter subunit IIA [Erysipelotrichaceae bacterium]MBQ5805398.1 PTS sugar transporter subunit IIA [Erysipelotrichaceae bacterium]
MLLDKKLVLFHQDCEDRDDAIARLAALFMESGVAKETYLQGLMDREVEFPTGLYEEGMYCGVAMPHTFAEHVNEKQIGFMSLNKPVKWHYMGDVSKEIDISCVFMLALKDGHDQLEMLRGLMKLFVNNELMERLQKIDTYEELIEIVTEAGINLE